MTPQALAPLAASGPITGVGCCAANLYAIGEDGCLRVSPLEAASAAPMRRNFRISPMPLSALAVLRTDLVAIGGHDNAVTLYSSATGSALAKHQVHHDTVTCLGVSRCRGILVSGSRDQSVRTWTVTNTSLKNEETFDDLQQPTTCVAVAENLVLAGAMDGQVIAWDCRSGQPVMERDLGSCAVACALSGGHFAMALDGAGDLRLWDLRMGNESLRLCVRSQAAGGSLAEACSFLTDFERWAVVGGRSESGRPCVALWDIPEQRERRAWALDADAGGDCGVRFLARGLPAGEGEPEGHAWGSFLSATATGAVHLFAR